VAAVACVSVRHPDVRFELAPYDFAAAERLSARLGISHVLAQVLVRRGLGEPEAAQRFLAADEIHPLEAFGGLREAAGAILGHVGRRSRITVHGDYDVDGICSTAVLVRALRTLGADVDFHLPSRIDDGYGLAAATVERLAARGTDLLVTVDCAITAVAEVAAARAAGIDVVVTDHHMPRADGALPDAPIVHPALGGYPCPDLCAAGVAHKLAQALLAAAGEDPGLADSDLDLVALATVADVVALTGENRRLVRAGLRALSVTRKPGLRALMEVARVDPSGIDETSIGFRLAPRLNAAGRLYRADAGLELLLTDDAERARAVAAELDAINAERRDVETRIRFQAEKLLSEQPPGAAAHVLAAEGWHPGVIGIVASRIAERHHRPAVLIALEGDEGTGSGRSIRGFDLLAGLQAGADELLRYGGHRAAAGLTIARGRVDAFREAFVRHAAEVLRPEDLVPAERIDAVAPGDVLRLDLAEELERLAPFGQGNPPVSLLVPAALLDDPRPMGEGRHVAFSLAAGGARSRCVAFGAGSRLPAEPGEPVDAAVRLEANRYNGRVEPRLVLRHARPATRKPIEVISEPEWHAGLLAELDRNLDQWPPPTPIAGSVAIPDPRSSRPQAPTPIAGSVAIPDPRNSQPEAGGRRLPAGGESPTEPRATPPKPRALRDSKNGVAGLLTDLVATGEPVLVLTAHARHRAHSMHDRLGGFALTSWAAIEDQPGLAEAFPHVVALDPPAHAHLHDLLEHLPGRGWAHLAWGEAELGFARRIHEWDYALRAPLVAVYRALREAGGATGEACEAMLAGDGAQPRSAALAGRLVRVLAELGLVALDREGPALTVAEPAERTALDRSAAFRAYHRRLQDGLTYLTTPRRAVA
jgi:single-stranded-DNA-specific exonuclease